MLVGKNTLHFNVTFVQNYVQNDSTIPASKNLSTEVSSVQTNDSEYCVLNSYKFWVMVSLRQQGFYLSQAHEIRDAIVSWICKCFHHDANREGDNCRYTINSVLRNYKTRSVDSSGDLRPVKTLPDIATAISTHKKLLKDVRIVYLGKKVFINISFCSNHNKN